MAEYEKEFREPLYVGRKPIAHNKLPDSYYIPSLDAFYIGEWVFDIIACKNVPGGIGRLYQQDTISEGVFKTCFTSFTYTSLD